MQLGYAGPAQRHDQDPVLISGKIILHIFRHPGETKWWDHPGKNSVLDTRKPAGKEEMDQPVPDFGIRDIVTDNHKFSFHNNRQPSGGILSAVLEGKIRTPVQ